MGWVLDSHVDTEWEGGTPAVTEGGFLCSEMACGYKCYLDETQDHDTMPFEQVPKQTVALTSAPIWEVAVDS